MSGLRHRSHAWLGGALALSAAAQSPVPVTAPRRFESVRWCGDAQHGAALAQRLGYTAVQLGRGADPAPVLAAGLGFYLDQPIGKGLLELRDADWQPIAAAYERARDPAALRRPGCFQVPGVLAAAAVAAAEETRRLNGDALRFVALADEASATRHDAPLDTCRCEHCLQAFRAFLQRRFPSIDAANAALGTQFPAFEQVVPVSTDQVRRRELGGNDLPADLRAFALSREFVDVQFAECVSTIAMAVQRAAPGVPVGLTGLQVPGAFGGNDYARLLPALTLAEPYAVGGACELARGLAAAGTHHYTTLLPPSPQQLGPAPLAAMVRAQVAAMACAGLSGVVVWNDGTVADAEGALTPFGAAVQRALRDHAAVLDACAGAALERTPVWVVESQASVRAWWMLDSVGDGMTWTRRLSSYEATHSTSQSARRGWSLLLQDLGLQPHFVAVDKLPELLLRERPRCLVLPATVALSDRVAQGITAYVRTGGVVVADHSVGLYDETLLRRGAGVLDALFGIQARSLAWNDLAVREGRSSERGKVLPLAERRLRGQLGERRADGDAQVEHSTGEGRAIYLNAPVVEYPVWRLDEREVGTARELRRRVRAALQRGGALPPCEVRGEGLPTCLERVSLRLRDGRQVLAIRINALDSPLLLQRLAEKGPRNVQIELPEVRTLRHLGGASIGTGTKFDLQLDPFGALWLEVVP